MKKIAVFIFSSYSILLKRTLLPFTSVSKTLLPGVSFPLESHKLKGGCPLPCCYHRKTKEKKRKRKNRGKLMGI